MDEEVAMTTNALMVTVIGWAATPPREISGDGVPFTSFRMGTTARYFDQRQKEWTDRPTEWITVKAFRETALNVAGSVRKGDPLVVHGRLSTDEWTGENGTRTSLVLDVTALGHDMTWGTSHFARRSRDHGHAGAAAVAGDEGAGEATADAPADGPVADREHAAVTP